MIHALVKGMTMKILPLLLLLAGCAVTPQQIMEQGTRYDARLKLPPAKAAECVARNAWNLNSDFSHTMLPLGEDGSMEVVLRVGSIVLTIVRLRPIADGTTATSWWRYTPREEWPGKVVEGC